MPDHAHRHDAVRNTYVRSSGILSFDDLQNWANEIRVTIHIAVMREPYLSMVCSGVKYIESRITKTKSAPFGRAASGDIILFKRSGGAITAMASIQQAEFIQLVSPDDIIAVADRYSQGLGFEPGYVESKQEAKFASLLWLEAVQVLPPRRLKKRDRQTWVSISPQS